MTREEELAVKRSRLQEWLRETGYEVVILSTIEKWAWYTGGGTNMVVMCADAGASFLIVDGEYETVLTDTVEAPRIEKEELHALPDAQLVAVPWWDNALKAAKAESIIAGRKACSDTGAFGADMLPASFNRITWALTDAEIERYRALGQDCSEIMEDALDPVSKGDREFDIAKRLAAGLIDRAIIPNLILVAADERVTHFRHPIPTEKRVDTYFMAVICGKRHGLIMNITRFAAFSDVDEELKRRFDKTTWIDARLNARTVPSAKIGDIFDALTQDYSDAGYPDEWHLHHQGGPTGYQGRSYKAAPHMNETVLPHQAFAWNPSITGAKCEDTTLVTDKGIELLSYPINWASVDVDTDQGKLKRATLLMK